MPAISAGRRTLRSGFDQVDGLQYHRANRSMATNNGASNAPAVKGSITSESKGMPMIAKPPPKAPFMNAMRKTPARASRTVAAPSSTMIPLKVGLSLHNISPDRGWPMLGQQHQPTSDDRCRSLRFGGWCAAAKKGRHRIQQTPTRPDAARGPNAGGQLNPRSAPRANEASVAIIPIASIAVGIGPIPAQIGSGPARDGSNDGHGNQCTQGNTGNDPAI